MYRLALVVSTALVLAPLAPAAAGPARPSGTQRMQEAAETDVPRCARKLGTVSVADGDDPSGWTQFSLAPPSKLLKVLIQRSGCFNLVDRGTGLHAAETERNIGAGLGLQRGSNVGIGQIKAADYVLVAEVQAANHNAGGSAIGAGLGGLVGGRFGALAGGIGSRKMEANTILSLTNVRTTETVQTEEGYAVKNSLSFGAGGGVGFFGGGIGAVGGGYDNTDIGRIVTLAFIQAYSKMVTDLNLVAPGSTGTAEASPTKAFTATSPAAMRRAPAAGGAVVRMLDPGATVYPTGKREGLWWEVADDNDNVGWVLNTKLVPAR